MLCSLPVELYAHICSFIVTRDLYSLLLASKDKARETERALYHTIDLRGLVNYFSLALQKETEDIYNLFKLLATSTRHALLVRTLHLPSIYRNHALATFYIRAILNLPHLRHLSAPFVPLECKFRLQSLKCAEPIEDLIALLRVQTDLTRLEWPWKSNGYIVCFGSDDDTPALRQLTLEIPPLRNLKVLVVPVDYIGEFLPATERLEELVLKSDKYELADILGQLPVMPTVHKLAAPEDACVTKPTLLAIIRAFPHLRSLDFNPDSGVRIDSPLV